jgi:hypothetical protein
VDTKNSIDWDWHHKQPKMHWVKKVKNRFKPLVANDTCGMVEVRPLTKNCAELN